MAKKPADGVIKDLQTIKDIIHEFDTKEDDPSN